MNNTTSDEAGAGFQIVDVGVWIPLVFIGLAILALNGIICVAYATNFKLRKSSTNLLICNQAVTDSVNALLVIPMHTAERYGKDGQISPALATYSILISICNLLSLAADRYLLIIKPLYHRKFISLGKAKVVVAFIWIVPALIAVIPAAWWTTEVKMKTKFAKGFNCAVLSLVISCMCLMVAIYTKIFSFVRGYIRGKRQSRDNSLSSEQQKRKDLAMVKKELRITRLFAALLLFFGLAYAPIVYLNLVLVLDQTNLAPIEAIEASMYLFVLNSVANPILCLMFKKDYQMAVLQMLKFQGMYRGRFSVRSGIRTSDSG